MNFNDKMKVVQISGLKLILATTNVDQAKGSIIHNRKLGNIIAILEENGIYAVFLVAENPELPKIRGVLNEFKRWRIGNSHFTSKHNTNGG